jgi:AraC family transcriptional regulator
MPLRESLAISEPIKAMVIDGFRLAERKHPPNWTLLPHAHESPMITIIIEGSCVETIDGRTSECMSKTLQVLPAGESHSLTFTESVRCLAIEVEPQRLEAIRRISKVLDDPLHIREGICSGLLMSLYNHFRMTDKTVSLVLEGLILQVLGEATSQKLQCRSLSRARWLLQARDMIHENALEGVSLVGIATTLGVHPTYLARMFRRFYGCSVIQYVQRVRLDYSIRELIESGKPIAQIAATAGFYDQSHFTNVFKSHLRMTPGAFRRMHKSSSSFYN